MQTAHDIRLKNFEILISEFWEGSQTVTAKDLGCTSSYVSNICNKRKPIGTSTARKIEKAAGKPVGWLDSEHTYDALFAKIRLLNQADRAAVKVLVDQLLIDRSGE